MQKKYPMRDFMSLARKKVTDPNGDVYIFSKSEYDIIMKAYNRHLLHFGKYDPFGEDQIFYRDNICFQKLEKLHKIKNKIEMKLNMLDIRFPVTPISELLNLITKRPREIELLYSYYLTCLGRVYRLMCPRFYLACFVEKNDRWQKLKRLYRNRKNDENSFKCVAEEESAFFRRINEK